MRKIEQVEITEFWGDKKVLLEFNDKINFLIGPNGSGKTTMINLIAATLQADFSTLDKFQFKKIKIDFYKIKKNDNIYIEVEKVEREDSPYPNIIFKIKDSKEEPKMFNLNELDEESHFRHRKQGLFYQRNIRNSLVRDITIALSDLVNLTWLSVHRTNRRNNEENFKSSIDQKIKELSTDFTKYFGILDKRYSVEAEKFQKNIFLSLIKDESEDEVFSFSNELDAESEKRALKEIFQLFGLKEKDFNKKLDVHFENFEIAKNKLTSSNEPGVGMNDLVALIGTRRIHSVVQEWNLLLEKKRGILKPKFTFIEIVNSLFQRKKIFIDKRNELLVKTQSGKIFSLSRLSSGEKQLLIILGQSLLQENNSHIYIADEPELSLHVEWQEKLVNSLRNLNSNSQIIFATHSPDIVGQYSNGIIHVEDIIL